MILSRNGKVQVKWIRPHVLHGHQSDIMYWIQVWDSDFDEILSVKITGLADENGFLIRDPIKRHCFFRVEEPGEYYVSVRIVLMRGFHHDKKPDVWVERQISKSVVPTRFIVFLDANLPDRDWEIKQLF